MESGDEVLLHGKRRWLNNGIKSEKQIVDIQDSIFSADWVSTIYRSRFSNYWFFNGKR